MVPLSCEVATRTNCGCILLKTEGRGILTKPGTWRLVADREIVRHGIDGRCVWTEAPDLISLSVQVESLCSVVDYRPNDLAMKQWRGSAAGRRYYTERHCKGMMKR